MIEPSQSAKTLEITESIATIEAVPRLKISAGIRRIVLTGFMGSGKSTTGRVLAERLGWNFLDLDNFVESRASLSVAEIFAVHGEAHFRRLESTGLAVALGRSNTVLALGGGTPESLTNRLLLEQTPATVTLLLDAPFPMLYDRCVLQALDRPEVTRPVLSDPALAQTRFNTRLPIYRRVARHTIDTSAQSPAETTTAILNALS